MNKTDNFVKIHLSRKLLIKLLHNYKSFTGSPISINDITDITFNEDSIIIKIENFGLYNVKYSEL